VAPSVTPYSRLPLPLLHLRGRAGFGTVKQLILAPGTKVPASLRLPVSGDDLSPTNYNHIQGLRAAQWRSLSDVSEPLEAGPEMTVPQRAAKPEAKRFSAVSAISRRGQVADVVRSAILSGALVPAEQLKQDELRAELGVSPTPIREALRQLESEGLVTHYPNRGVFVASVSLEELFGVLLPVRLVLERYALSQALPELGEELLEALEQQVRVMEQGAADDDSAAVYEADMAFHEFLVASSGAPHTIQLWRAVQPRVRVVMYQLGPRHVSLEEIPAEHREFLDAIKRADPSEIEKVLERHIVGDSERLLAMGTANNAERT
jgi:DNA-binding GntR family transcriptional regulator